jgi:hypothetical protein
VKDTNREQTARLAASAINQNATSVGIQVVLQKITS